MSDSETERKIRRDLRDAVEEHSAIEPSCPWCAFGRWDPRHISKAHPDEWERWKADHEQITITKSVWVEQ